MDDNSMEFENDELFTSNICLICKKEDNKVEYMCMPCKCSIICKKCAMKVATGGKCKNCKRIFTECARI